MAERGPREIVGGSEYDRQVARLLERTEVIMEQSKVFNAAMESMRGMMASMQNVIVKLEMTVQHLSESAPNYRQISVDNALVARRLEECEQKLSSYDRVKGKVIYNAMLMAAVAITSGTFGGTLVREVLGLK